MCKLERAMSDKDKYVQAQAEDAAAERFFAEQAKHPRRKPLSTPESRRRGKALLAEMRESAKLVCWLPGHLADESLDQDDVNNEDSQMQTLGEFKCGICGRVAVGVSLAQAMKYVDDFDDYFARLTEDERSNYSSDRAVVLANYLQCHGCGAPASAFVAAALEDAPPGCTLGIIAIDA
jgi:hypothetical protein